MLIAGEDIIESQADESIELDAPTGEEKASILRQPLDIAGILGFGLYLAWFYLMLTSSISGVNELTRVTQTLLVLSFIVGIACCSLILVPCAKAFSRRGVIRVLAVIAYVLLSLPGIASLFDVSETILFAALFLSGVGALLTISLHNFGG